MLAINAGYFIVKTGTCLGSVVSDGRIVQKSNGILNVHFGVLKNGNIFTGYLEDESDMYKDFAQLVGGVIWLVKNGTVFINESMKIECSDAEDTGTLETFVNIHSARTTIGHDSHGNIIILQVDGKTGLYGASLWDMANLLIELGAVNAINLDGGGSSTFAVNNTVVNFPSDECGNMFTCERPVSTIICVHQPDCGSLNCSGNGDCIMGKCKCRNQWNGENCNFLSCQNKTRCVNGLCTVNGCSCYPGWRGEFCNTTCPPNSYGSGCGKKCTCLNEAFCHSTTGQCQCAPGYTGLHCEHKCLEGFFGGNCQYQCSCKDSCFCDHVTGECKINAFSNSTNLCLQKLNQEKSMESSTCDLWKIVGCGLSVISVASLCLNIALVWCSLKPNEVVEKKDLLKRNNNHVIKKAKKRSSHIRLGELLLSSSSESEENI